MNEGGILIQYDSCPYKKGKFAHRDMHTGRRPYEDCSYAAESQGLPEARREARSRSSLGLQCEHGPGTLTLDSASKTVRIQLSVVLSHPVSGALLWKP